MAEISITLLFISIISGFILGIISGLTPGIHVNNFALILVAFSSVFLDMGLAPLYISVMILSNSITHTFIDIIPSIFLGAPEADTALAVLPGHRLLMDGNGSEAIRLSALGSAGSVVVSLILAVPLGLFFKNFYNDLNDYIGWILVLIVILMIATENGEIVEGQGSLVHYKYKIYAVFLFLISGMLGVFAFENEGKISPLFEIVEPSILFPLLSGIFGASMLLLSLMTGSVVPEQKRNSGFRIDKRRIIRGMVTGSTAGAFVAWLPGVSSAVGTVISRLLVKDDKDEDSSKEFIISVSGANTSNAIFSLLALAIILKTRSGAMAAIDRLINVNDMGFSIVILFLIVISFVSLISYYTTISLGERISGFLPKIRYNLLCTTVLAGLTLMVLLFTGLFGLVIFIISVPVGMIASFAKIRKTHAMGVIMLPIIMYFF